MVEAVGYVLGLNLLFGVILGLASEEKFQFHGHSILLKRKAYQKRLSLTVYPSGLIKVSANKSLHHREIVKFLEKQKDWIEDSVEEAEKLKRKYPPKIFKEGELYPFVGTDYRLKIVFEKSLKLRFSKSEIVFEIPHSQNTFGEKQRQEYLQLFKKSYRQVAESFMTQRVKLYSDRMELYPKSIHFRDQKSIWGSCSPENKISLNFKLIVAPIEIIDYVVVHELAHIRHKNHSSRFWNLVEKFTDHRQYAKEWLKSNQYKTDFLAKKPDLHP